MDLLQFVLRAELQEFRDNIGIELESWANWKW